MHRCMNQHRLAICVPQSTYYSLTAMRRRYPRPRRLDWPTCRANQSAERLDPGPFLASAQDLSAPDIPSGQVLQSSASLVLVFHLHRPPRAGRQRRMAADAGLDACLLVRTDDVVLATQWFAFPGTIVRIEDPCRFLGEPRISRKDPVLVTPRLDRVGIENSPDRAGTDDSADRSRGSSGEIREGQPTQGELSLADSLTSDGLNDGLITRGKKRAFARVLPDPPKRSRLEPNGDARGVRNWDAIPRRHQPRRWTRLVIRRVGVRASPFGIEQARRTVDERDRDIFRRVQPEILVDQEALGRA